MPRLASTRHTCRTSAPTTGRLAMRHLAMPMAWNPEFRGLRHLLLKVPWYVSEPLFRLVCAKIYWVIVAAVGIVLIAYVIARLRLDALWTAVWLTIGSSVWCLLSAEVGAATLRGC